MCKKLVQLGWKLSWNIHFSSTLPNLGKEETAQFLGDKRIKATATGILVMQKPS